MLRETVFYVRRPRRGVKWYAHTACSLMLAIALNPAWVPLALIGSTLPDAVERILGAKHRSMHELMLWLPLLPLLATGYGGLALGAIHHVLLDALTVHGVTAAGRRIRGPFSTSRPLDNLAAILLHMPILLLL